MKKYIQTCNSKFKSKGIFISVQSFLNFFFMLALVVSVFIYVDDLNSFYICYCGDLLQVVYDFLLSHPIVYLFCIILISLTSLRELSKQFKNQYISYLRLSFLIISMYVLSNSSNLGWNYILIYYINLKWVLFIICSVSLIIEMYKVRKMFRLFFPSTKTLELRTRLEKGYSLFSTQEQMQDVRLDEYINAVVENIKKIIVSDDSFAVGLASGWGTGKTTFLKALNARIKKEISPCVLISFNPWTSNGLEAMVKDFFITLQDALTPFYSNIDRVLANYCNKVLEAYDEKYTRIIRLLFYKKNAPLQSQYREIEQILDRIDRKIFITIDDIDRLDKDEILEVLKLIRNTASFKHVIYLTAYDKDYIVRSLKSKSIISPVEYLKKIFPMELTLPSFESKVFPDLLQKELLRLAPKEVCTLISDKLHGEIFKRNVNAFVISEYLHSFRDVKNFSIAFSADLLPFMYPENILANISIRDFFWLEIIRFSNYQLYEKLKSPQCLQFLEKETDKMNMSLCFNMKDNLNPSIKEPLQLLFNVNSESQDVLSIKYLVNYKRYFSYRLEESDIDILKFQKFVQSSEQKQKEWLDSLFREKNDHRHSFHHLSMTYIMTNRSLGELKGFIHLISFWIGYGYSDKTFLYEIFRVSKFKPFESDKSCLEKEFCNSISSCIKEYTVCQSLTLAGQLQEMYAYELLDGSNEPHYENETIIENIEIERLIIQNFEHIMDTLNPHIEDLVSEDTPLSKIVSSSIVLLCQDTAIFDEETGHTFDTYKNLVFERLINYYISSKKTNAYKAFIEKYTPDFAAIDYGVEESEVIGRNRADIMKLFVDIPSYKSFLESCFEIPESELIAYYKTCRILNL